MDLSMTIFDHVQNHIIRIWGHINMKTKILITQNSDVDKKTGNTKMRGQIVDRRFLIYVVNPIFYFWHACKDWGYGTLAPVEQNISVTSTFFFWSQHSTPWLAEGTPALLEGNLCSMRAGAPTSYSFTCLCVPSRSSGATPYHILRLYNHLTRESALT